MSNSYTPGVRHIFDYLNVIRREEPAFDESFDSGDLSRYTEAKFFDFDMGQPGEEVVVKKDVGTVEPASIDLGMKGGEMEFLGMAPENEDLWSSHANPAEVPAFWGIIFFLSSHAKLDWVLCSAGDLSES